MSLIPMTPEAIRDDTEMRAPSGPTRNVSLDGVVSKTCMETHLYAIYAKIITGVALNGSSTE